MCEPLDLPHHVAASASARSLESAFRSKGNPLPPLESGWGILGRSLDFLAVPKLHCNQWTPPNRDYATPHEDASDYDFYDPRWATKKRDYAQKLGGFWHFFWSKKGSVRVKHRTKRATTEDYATPLEDSRPRAAALIAERATRTCRIICSTCVPCPTMHVRHRPNASMQVHKKPYAPSITAGARVPKRL